MAIQDCDFSDRFVEVVRIANRNHEVFSDSFLDWLPQNEGVWNSFVYEANKVWERGFKHYSARTIIHVIRHHSMIHEVSGEPWKVNNDHSPYLARLFDLVYPERAGLWEYRETKKVTKRQHTNQPATA